jgi:branched-chain amino acid transport system ATP-binding protein
VSLQVRAGEVVTLLGRNGMGKTTTVKTIMGLLSPLAGGVRMAGEPAVQGLPAWRVARRGIGLVPEGRQVFPNLSVRENLVATRRATASARARPGRWSACYGMFPRLRERAATSAPTSPAASSRCWPSGARS